MRALAHEWAYTPGVPPALPPPAVPVEERYLVNDRLAVGVAPDGSLVNQAIQLGLIGDPDGPEGPVPVGGEQLLPGKAWALWALSSVETGDLVMDAGFDGAGALVLDWEEIGLADGLSWLRGQGATPELTVVVTLALPEGAGHLLWAVDVTAMRDLTGVQVAHVLDPDPDFAFFGSYDSDNTALDGVATGASPSEPSALALALAGGAAGVCEWCNTAGGIFDGVDTTRAGDFQIGVATQALDLPAGASVRVQVGYALATDADSAAAAAGAAATTRDWDADGFDEDQDCDDLDADTNPEAAEATDGRDNDCNGVIDDDPLQTDDDGDGYAEVDGDCDDADPETHPGAVGEGPDANCDGVADEEWNPDIPAANGASVGEGANGCGCQSGARPGIAPWVILAVLGRRRRQ